MGTDQKNDAQIYWHNGLISQFRMVNHLWFLVIKVCNYIAIVTKDVPVHRLCEHISKQWPTYSKVEKKQSFNLWDHCVYIENLYL